MKEPELKPPRPCIMGERKTESTDENKASAWALKLLRPHDLDEYTTKKKTSGVRRVGFFHKIKN